MRHFEDGYVRNTWYTYDKDNRETQTKVGKSIRNTEYDAWGRVTAQNWKKETADAFGVTYEYPDSGNNKVVLPCAMTNGNFPDFIFDIASVIVGISDVITDSMDKLNWISLGADVLCTFLPGLTGGGRIVRAVTKSDDALDAAKAVYKAADKSSDIRKATGSY